MSKDEFMNEDSSSEVTTKRPAQNLGQHKTGNAATRKEIQVRVKNLPAFKGLSRLKRCFLTAYAGTFDIQKSAAIVGCHWRLHYVWLAKDPAYKLAFEEAREIAGDVLESAVYDAVMNGDDKVLSFKGHIIERYKQKSDILRIFMLKGLKPQYRDSFNLSAVTGPISLSITYPGSSTKPVIEEAQLIDESQDKHD